MLASLTVKNLALVEGTTIDFAPGLNVVTGETGAGKSVFIGALRLLSGERADKGMIRTGTDRASAEAIFELADPAEINELLEDLGVDPCEDGQLLLRRVIKAGGGSQARINNCGVTLAVMKAVGVLLLDMHGPYDHQSLLKPDTQMAVLDSYGRTEKERAAYAAQWEICRALESRKLDLLGDADSVAQQMDILGFKVRELEEADLQEGEEQSILQEHTVVANAQTLLESGNTAASALETGAFEALVIAQRALEDIGDKMPEGAGWFDEARSIAIQISELSTDLRSRINRINADPARLEFLDERLMVIRSIKRKYGPEISDALALLKESRRRLDQLGNLDGELAKIDAELDAAIKELKKIGKKLSKKRGTASEKLAAAITGHLRELGFEHGGFSVDVTVAAEPRSSGLDDIDFGFAPNAGEDMRPLKAIASSGEIARVMLACKAVLAEHDKVPLLVFDEIDANVGGEMGVAIGEKLRDVAAHHQLIAITHLPQVAVCGGHHLLVEKSVVDGRTVTEVTSLSGKTRVDEISRMLGGKGASRDKLAKEMLGV